jgi:hypothetical protein
MQVLGDEIKNVNIYLCSGSVVNPFQLGQPDIDTGPYPAGEESIKW